MTEEVTPGDRVGDANGVVDNGDIQWVSPSVEAALNGQTVEHVIEPDSIETTVIEGDAK